MFYMLVLMVASSIICMDASMDTHILLKLKAALKPMKLARCMRI